MTPQESELLPTTERLHELRRTLDKLTYYVRSEEMSAILDELIRARLQSTGESGGVAMWKLTSDALQAFFRQHPYEISEVWRNELYGICCALWASPEGKAMLAAAPVAPSSVPAGVEEAFEAKIVRRLAGRYDEKQRVGDFAMFSLGYAAAPSHDKAKS